VLGGLVTASMEPQYSPLRRAGGKHPRRSSRRPPPVDRGSLAENRGWDVGATRRWCTAGAAAAVALTVLLTAAAPAHASMVSDHLNEQRRVGARIRKVTRHAHERARNLHRAVTEAEQIAGIRPGNATLTVLRSAYDKERNHARAVARRLRTLRSRRDVVAAWLSTWAVFRVCPVDPPRYLHDDFGEIVRVEKVKPHVHMGNDIEAPTYTPIRAPFDGYASSSSSPLGGYQVRVHGDRGYVFNAHLISFGTLGWVEAGTVIGYVGSTGLSTAPHLHFEWHPGGGPAVDPNYLLHLTCG
jgi:murein DD-endopeptidase MepM/ murein hydrolase activator NlpD